MIINNLSFETSRGSRSAQHWLLSLADWLVPATTAAINHVRSLPAQTLHWVPFRSASLQVGSQISTWEGSLYCSLPIGCERSEQVTGQIYTDKTITNSQLWQGGNCPGELSAHENPTNSTPALPKVQDSSGAVGHAHCINTTCVVPASPSLLCCPLMGPQLGYVSPSCCGPHWR